MCGGSTGAHRYFLQRVNQAPYTIKYMGKSKLYLHVYFAYTESTPNAKPPLKNCHLKGVLWSYFVNKQMLRCHSVFLTETHCVYP